MGVPREIRHLAVKLLDCFASRPGVRDPFDRYWALIGPLEDFCSRARGPLQMAVGEALRNALEAALRSKAQTSAHPDAVALRALRPEDALRRGRPRRRR